jgi:hypothetical protein
MVLGLRDHIMINASSMTVMSAARLMNMVASENVLYVDDMPMPLNCEITQK